MDVVFLGLGACRMALWKNFESSMFFFYSFKILKERAENRGEVINSAEIKNFQDVFV